MGKWIVSIRNAFGSKKQKIQFTEAHAINNFNFSHIRTLYMSSPGQMQQFNSVPSLCFAVLDLCCWPCAFYLMIARWLPHLWASCHCSKEEEEAESCPLVPVSSIGNTSFLIKCPAYRSDLCHVTMVSWQKGCRNEYFVFPTPLLEMTREKEGTWDLLLGQPPNNISTKTK